MAMRPECRQVVQQAAEAAGLKPRSDAQIDAIDSRLRGKMRQLARTDEEWQSKSADQRLSEAAAAAIKDIGAEADRRVANAHLQIVKTAATDSRIADQMAHHGESRSNGLVRDMDESGHYIAGIKNAAMSRLAALADATKSGEGVSAGRRVMQFLFDVENPQMTRDLANEIYRNGDGSTGNKLAQEGAKAYLTVSEESRQRFNAAGGDVGKLDYGYLRPPWDAVKVRKAGVDAFAAKVAQHVDRSRMLREDGARLNDVELDAMLRSSFETLSTEGLNKMEPGKGGGSGARANHGSESREIHFKDGDAWLAVNREFGKGSMYEAILRHVGSQARDIGLVERYGPNPNAQIKLQMDIAKKTPEGLERSFGMKPQSYWDTLNGTAASADSATLAKLGENARNVQVYTKLGAAVISSITDVGTFITNTGFNKLSYWDAIKNVGRSAASKEARAFMTAHGIIAETMKGDLDRFSGENLSQSWSGRIAQATMKLTLMNAWTDTLRRGFQLTMMQGLARMSKTEWGKLTEWDRTSMERHGLTEADWQVMQRAELTHYSGLDHMTPDAIKATGDARANEVIAKVLGLIQDEGEYAVLNPDMATRALASGGGMQRGTVRGELARSVMQFKSFPIAMISRHWRRMMDAPKVSDGSAPAMANPMVYGGALLLSTTALGAIALQAKQIVAGKDPIDMIGPHAAKFWTQAVAQGGGLSMVGDMLLKDSNSSVGDWTGATIKTLAGPAIGSMFDAVKIAKTNIDKKLDGKQTHAGAEAVAWARSMAPFVNMWYAKAAVDHMGMHALQENLSPGYLSKIQQSAQKDWGQSFWWKPGTGTPQRGPDMAKAVQ